MASSWWWSRKDETIPCLTVSLPHVWRHVSFRVEAGDIVMVVESDKADMDVEAFESGFLAK